MFLYRGLNTPHVGRSWRGRLVSVLPWVFVLGVAAGSLLPLGNWHGKLGLPPKSADELQRERDSETIWRRAGNPQTRHTVDVLRTIDGDTFDARVTVWPGFELNTRVRLRGIDAPEMSARCVEERTKAEEARAALLRLLNEGAVAISNIGQDKYGGRVDADVSTARTSNVSASLLERGLVRHYARGKRENWC